MKTKLSITKTELEALVQKHSDPEIARMFNACSSSVKNWRDKFGIKPLHRLKRAKTHRVNEAFFSEIDSEVKAYTLGFFAGDGNVHPRERSFSIGVSSVDQDILYKIRSAMESDIPIKIVSNSRGYNPDGKMAILDVSRMSMVKDLSRLGFHPRKTRNLHYPNLPKELDHHFIRGLLDADGSISDQNFFICGDSALIYDSVKKIRQHTNHTLLFYEKGLHFRVWGLRRDKDVLRWLYDGSTIFLDRKFFRYKDFWS